MSADMKWESIVELEGEVKLIGKKEEDKWSFAKIESKDYLKKLPLNGRKLFGA